MGMEVLSAYLSAEGSLDQSTLKDGATSLEDMWKQQADAANAKAQADAADSNSK